MLGWLILGSSQTTVILCIGYKLGTMLVNAIHFDWDIDVGYGQEDLEYLCALVFGDDWPVLVSELSNFFVASGKQCT
jgi:hypothetical protein